MGQSAREEGIADAGKGLERKKQFFLPLSFEFGPFGGQFFGIRGQGSGIREGRSPLSIRNASLF
jgi:hypothetical protein